MIKVMHKGKELILDLDDLYLLAKYNWFYVNGYLSRNTGVQERKTQLKQEGRFVQNLRFHQHKLVPPPGMRVDHANRNTLDNRSENLRVATQAQNGINRSGHIRLGKQTSKFKGVYKPKNRNKWYAAITVNNKKIDLGQFWVELDAAKAYNAAAYKYFGEFAYLNPIE